MAQKRFWNWADEDSTFDLSRWRLGIIDWGRYRGFDVTLRQRRRRDVVIGPVRDDVFGRGDSSTSSVGIVRSEPDSVLTAPERFDPNETKGMHLILHHLQTGARRTKLDRSVSDKFGVLVSRQGVVVHEDEKVEFDIVPTEGVDRIDRIVFEHEYKDGLTGGIDGTYRVISTAADDIDDDTDLFTIGNPLQIVLGYLYIPANCTDLRNGATYHKAPTPPFAGHGDYIEKDGGNFVSNLSGDGNRIINLGNPINAQDAATKFYVDYAISNNVRTATEERKGIAELATQQETREGQDHTRIVTPKTLELQFTFKRASQIETNSDHVNNRYVTPKTLALRTATENRTGLAKIATVDQALNRTDDSTIITPYKLGKAVPVVAQYLELGGWNMNSSLNRQIPHTLPWWEDVVAISVILYNDSSNTEYRMYNTKRLTIDNQVITIEGASDHNLNLSAFSNDNENRGYVVLWRIVGEQEVDTSVFVNVGSDMTLNLESLYTGVPHISYLRFISIGRTRLKMAVYFEEGDNVDGPMKIFWKPTGDTYWRYGGIVTSGDEFNLGGSGGLNFMDVNGFDFKLEGNTPGGTVQSPEKTVSVNDIPDSLQHWGIEGGRIGWNSSEGRYYITFKFNVPVAYENAILQNSLSADGPFTDVNNGSNPFTMEGENGNSEGYVSVPLNHLGVSGRYWRIVTNTVSGQQHISDVAYIYSDDEDVSPVYNHHDYLNGANPNTEVPIGIFIDGYVNSTGSAIDSIEWTIVSGPNGTGGYFSDSSNEDTYFHPDMYGQYVLRLRAENENGDVGTDSLILTINPVSNQAPIAEARWGWDNGFDERSYTLNLAENTEFNVLLNGAFSSDNDGNIISYEWQVQRSSQPWEAIQTDDNSVPTASKSINAGGTYKFRVRVTDNDGATSEWSNELVLNLTVITDTSLLNVFDLNILSGGQGQFHTQAQLLISPVAAVHRLHVICYSYTSSVVQPIQVGDFFLKVQGNGILQYFTPDAGIAKDLTSIISPDMRIWVDLGNIPPTKTVGLKFIAYDTNMQVIEERTLFMGHH